LNNAWVKNSHSSPSWVQHTLVTLKLYDNNYTYLWKVAET